MRLFQILIALLFCSIALFTEFRSVKESTLFTDWLNPIPFGVLCVSTITFLVINSRQYISYRQFVSFLPLILCVTSLFLCIWHQKKMEQSDNSPTKFAASTFAIGSDGGLVLDFKTNGQLKAEKRDHWAVTYYWGRYFQHHDTVDLDIPFNF